MSLKKPTLKKLQELSPSQVVQLPLPQRLSLPPVSRWDAIKAFFKYSEVILLARIETTVGFFTLVLGSLDYSPLFGLTAFDKKQVLYLGGISLVKGIFTELARRRNMMTQPPTTEG